MIHISTHSKRKRYHTTKCRVVHKSPHIKTIDDEIAAQRIKDKYSECKFCSDEFDQHAGRGDMSHYQALADATPGEIL